MKISKNSWHYYLLREYSNHGLMYIDDSCQYLKEVCRTIGMVVIFTIFLGMIIGSIFGGAIGWISAMISLGYYINPEDDVLFPFYIFFICAVSAFVVGAWYHIDEYLNRNMSQFKEKPFIRQAYEHIKGKYCSKIEFDDA